MRATHIGVSSREDSTKQCAFKESSPFAESWTETSPCHFENGVIFLIANETQSQYVHYEVQTIEPTSTDTRPKSWLPLPQAVRGQKVRVQRLEGHESVCNRLREMGFCELSEVRVLNNNGATLCQVCGAKVCLSRQIADVILVEPSES